MGEEVPEWQMMWGAKVKTPVDMPDDVLKDSIMTTKELITGCAHIDAEANSAIKSIKDHMDQCWEPNWHVVIGRNFGSKITHETHRFVYFYLQEKAVMIYKAG